MHFANQIDRPACGAPLAETVTRNPAEGITCEACRRAAIRYVLHQVAQFVASKISRCKLNELCGLTASDNASMDIANELPEWCAGLRAINTQEPQA